MISNRSLLEHVLVAYREDDMDECIRLVRTLVEAAPLATAPRQLLASIFAQTGRGRLAIGHYRKLLTSAVARGEVIRAIAFQKQIDAFQPPEAQAPDRWAALHGQLRSHDLSFLVVASGSSGRPWAEAQLLALPRSWFERLAAETRFDYFGIEPRAIEAETGSVWEVLGGRLRWSFALSDGRASVEALAVEGDAIHVDPELARHARLTFVPELPAETLCFDAALVREVKAALAEATANSGARKHGRAEMGLPSWTSLRPPQDPDRARAPMPPASNTPPRLAERNEDVGAPTMPARDSGDWLEFGMVSLGGVPAEAAGDSGPGAAARSPVEAGAPHDASPSDLIPPTPEAAVSTPSGPGARNPSDLPGSPAEGESPAPRLSNSAQGEPDQTGSGEDSIPPPSDGASSPSGVRSDAPFERRRHPRVAVSLESRMALLGLTESPLAPIRGMLTDLSTSGLRVRFATQELGASRGALADAVVAVDVELPGLAGATRLAAQVRWLEVDEQAAEARIGIEFVLLTEPDRRRIAGALARAALAAYAAGRKAA